MGKGVSERANTGARLNLNALLIERDAEQPLRVGVGPLFTLQGGFPDDVCGDGEHPSGSPL